jgi:hypothetical protein
MSHRLPNFLIVGAARSGTTSLFWYLREHPEIFMHGRKEGMFFSDLSTEYNGPGRYFNDSVITSIEDYEALFSGVSGETAIGDASPDYLYYFDRSIENITRFLGKNVKIIILLRNPNTRVYSQYFHHLKYGVEPLSFDEALRNEEKRMAANWFWTYHYKAVGLYHDQVRAYLDHFSNVAVYLYDDLETDASKLVRGVFSFLGVDASFRPDVSFRYLASGTPRNKGIDLIIRGLRSPGTAFLTKRLYRSLKGQKGTRQLLERVYASLLKTSPNTAAGHAVLADVYAADILKLQSLIGRDLTAWLD